MGLFKSLFGGNNTPETEKDKYVQRHTAPFLGPLEQGRPAGDVPYVRL